MSQITLNTPFENIHGKFGKNVVMRQKKFRAPSGKVIFEGVKESYPIENPRDYVKNPPKGEELANIRLFGDVSRLTAQIINSEFYTDDELAAMTPEQREFVRTCREQLEDFKNRFLAQIKRPDPEAPLLKAKDPNSMLYKRKTYKTLRTFIQGIIRERIKNQHTSA